MWVTILSLASKYSAGNWEGSNKIFPVIAGGDIFHCSPRAKVVFASANASAPPWWTAVCCSRRTENGLPARPQQGVDIVVRLSLSTNHNNKVVASFTHSNTISFISWTLHDKFHPHMPSTIDMSQARNVWKSDKSLEPGMQMSECSH